MRSLAIAGATAVAMIAAAARADAACGSRGVYLFEASWCVSCRKVVATLARYNVRYTGIEVTGNARVRAFMAKQFGSTAIPVTVIDDSFVVGFDEPRLKRLLCLN
jgi:glutaredoxin